MTSTVAGRATASCVGGLLDPEKDGEDLTTDEALKSAAVRHAKAQINVDLSGCDFHKFLELQYENGYGAAVVGVANQLEVRDMCLS